MNNNPVIVIDSPKPETMGLQVEVLNKTSSPQFVKALKGSWYY